MAPRDWRVRLDDVAQYAEDAMAFVAGTSFDAFVADVRTQRAVFYSLFVVGEAAKHVPASVRAMAPDAEWTRAIRFRDRVAHGYDALALPTVWDIVTRELPPLRDRIAALVAEMSRADELRA